MHFLYDYNFSEQSGSWSFNFWRNSEQNLIIFVKNYVYYHVVLINDPLKILLTIGNGTENEWRNWFMLNILLKCSF